MAEATEKAKNAPPKETPPSSANSRQEQQTESLIKLYKLIPSNVLDGEVTKTLRQIIEALQTSNISRKLKSSFLEATDLKLSKQALDEIRSDEFPEEILEKLKPFVNKAFQTERTFLEAITEAIGKEHAMAHGPLILKQANLLKKESQEAFENMGTVNRQRMESLVELASDDIKALILEAIFLFDINPDAPPIEIQEKLGFDEEGEEITKTHKFPVFQKSAIAGLEGIQRFLPDLLKTGGEETQGLQNFIRNEYPEWSSQFGKASHHYIRAITTIGSLGGIGHKSDSDMDTQIIIDTMPNLQENWNDADFFIAFLERIFYETAQATLETVMSPDERLATEETVLNELKEKYNKGLTEDEMDLIPLILPSSYQIALHEKIWQSYSKLPSSQVAKVLWEQISQVFHQNPFFEVYFKPISRFFSFIQVRNENKMKRDWFPYSLKSMSKERLWGWIVEFYRTEYLNRTDAQMTIRQYAQKKGIATEEITPKIEQQAILEHLSNLNQRGPVIKSFLHDLMKRISLEAHHLVSGIINHLIEQFDRKKNFLMPEFIASLADLNIIHFRQQMVGLIDFHREQLAIKKEAECEYAMRQKVKWVEAYLTYKYPHTEVHFFTNILRNQRIGQHTPFLVSPEGSMAYDLMLNDFLLNPAILLSGTTPIPFNIPHDLRTLCQIGVFSPHDWEFQHGEETFTICDLPDWGEINIPKNKFLEHSIPIFLRESEKISHRNLPKALLNCWWIEMICCLESDDTPPTSLTHLLFHPDERFFIKNNMANNWVRNVKMLEKEYPQLVIDPWWIKFTEMLFKFEDSEIQSQIIFCFAQHIRLSDVIDFNNDGLPIWVDDQMDWRTKAMVSFYKYFFETQDSRLDQMKFAQGRDDVGNRVEKTLKLLFLKSLRNVEKKLINAGNTKALKLLMGYVLKIGGNTIGPRANEVATYTLTQLHKHQNYLMVTDDSVVKKVENNEAPTSIEKIQWDQIQDDKNRVKKTVEELMYHYEKMGLAPSPFIIEKQIYQSRVQLAGDPLENAIFKYHFEQNFKRKPFQIPPPISKNLSIPRKKITIEFNSPTQKWLFKAMLSKKDILGPRNRYARENTIEMFESSLVEGIVRCVFSGYLGFEAHNLTSFEKPPMRVVGIAASNPVTNQDLQILAAEIYHFFKRFVVQPRELLQNDNYIREIFMVCNVNRFNTISLIVRDNFNRVFVVNYDISRIKVVVRPSQMKVDFNLSRFFLQFNSRYCRLLFMQALQKLNIPLTQNPNQKFKIWINTGNFNFTIDPKFHRMYLDGIVNALWPTNPIHDPEFLQAKKLKHSFEFYGQQAITRRES